MNDEPLLRFKSHIEGKNADVAVFLDRLEWAQEGRLTLSRISAAGLTVGKSARKTGLRKGGGSEMIPIRSISSVTVERDGFRQNVKVICSGNTIDFRVGRGEADDIKKAITQLVLGSHPAQQTAETPASPSQSAPSSGSVSDELVRLAGLRDSGVLNDEEFAAAKARLLAP